MKETARMIGFDAADLQRIVLYHELAHQITHRGLDAGGKDWENFCSARRKKKEYFAQLYSYKYVGRERWNKGIQVMTILSRHDTQIYRSYLTCTRLSMDTIYDQLMRERRRKPGVIPRKEIKEIPIEKGLAEKVQEAIDSIQHLIDQWKDQRKDYDTPDWEIARVLGFVTTYEKLRKWMDEIMWSEQSQHPVGNNDEET